MKYPHSKPEVPPEAGLRSHPSTPDGYIGAVSGFWVDNLTRAMPDMAVETGHWYSGKEILIAQSQISHISYGESKVFVNLTKADILRTVENDVARAGA